MYGISKQFSRLTCVWLFLAASLLAQSAAPQASSSSMATVPTLVKFSGALTGASSRLVGITFAFYKEQQGGAPLWLETQSVRLDAAGHYSVELGSTQANGLPKELFASGEARWLGVQREGQTEQPRVLLLSVPYALKAADAETLGGLPLSAFVLATPSNATPASAGSATSASAPPSSGGVTGSGTANFVPLWDTTSDIVNSAISQTGSGTTAKIGINTATPTVTLDVKGASTIRGALTMATTGVATAATGKNSQPLNLSGSAFNSGTAASVNQTFRLLTEPVGNNSTTPSGKLNLLFYSGANAASETGLSIASNGQITFAPGQTFPGAGGGSITGVTAGTALTGGGTTGSVTLNLDTAKVPLLSTANTFTGNQTMNGNLSATGAVSAASYQIGSSLFASGNATTNNVYMGFAGNQTTSGYGNTGVGGQALVANAGGINNTAVGQAAMPSNNSGTDNVAMGVDALQSNTQGNYNTGLGVVALYKNTTGSYNTGVGYAAGPDPGHPNLTNATAIGANAVVSESNALVLGPAGINVGIGTSTPVYPLHVNGVMRSELGLSLGGNAPVAVDAPGIVGGRLSILANGNVGINKSNPGTTLDVVGNINTSSSLTGAVLGISGAAVINGVLTANSGMTTGAGVTVGGPLNANGGLTIKSDTPMNAAPHMYFSGFFAGSIAQGQEGAFIVPSRSILITRMTMMSGFAQIICSPPGTISIRDDNAVTYLYGQNFAGPSASDSGPLSIPVAAGTPIELIVSVGPNCGIYQGPNNVNVNVEYVMQ